MAILHNTQNDLPTVRDYPVENTTRMKRNNTTTNTDDDNDNDDD